MNQADEDDQANEAKVQDQINEKQIPPTSPNPKIVEAEKKIVKNQTARRIGIKSKSSRSNLLIIDPFGSRTVSAEVLNEYQWDTWNKLNLITVDKVAEDPTAGVDSKLAIAGCLVLLAVLFWIVSIPLAIFSTGVTWGHVAIGTVSFIILIIVAYAFAYRPKNDEASSPQSRQFTRWLPQLPSLILVLTICVGIPTSVMYFFGGGKALLDQNQALGLAFLGRSLQLGFIVIACTLPALMYFMFGRQQVEKLRDKFVRDVMTLDPDVQTTLETQTKYDPLFDSNYGLGKTPLDSVPIYISCVLITFGWMLTLSSIGRDLTLDSNNLLALFTPRVSALNYGFFGAYFFSINMVFRRYVRADLTPKTYTYISIRFLVTAVLVGVISAVTGLISGDNNSAILVIAFLIGIFPETGTALLQDFGRKAFGRFLPVLKEDHPLTNLEGINLFDLARLLEEGIDNIENLAHSNIFELMVRTRIPTSRLVDWFDQAVLYLHLGLDPEKLLETRQKLREYGIRTATDLQLAIGPKQLKDGLPELTKLMVIERALGDDEWLRYLKHWRNPGRSNHTVKSPEEFYPENSDPKVSDTSPS